MIKSNELRIGNLVYQDYDKDKTARISGIHEGEMACEPIDLSPEILEKAGFEKWEGGWNNKHLKFRYFPFIDGDQHILYLGDEIDFVVSVKYVHQLQNLYFTLAGEELAIEL